ncbi:hypothetical protein TNCV_4689401, partial [Trichonephila clavipes]
YIDSVKNQLELCEHVAQKAQKKDASTYADFPILPEELPPLELMTVSLKMLSNYTFKSLFCNFVDVYLTVDN